MSTRNLPSAEQVKRRLRIQHEQPAWYALKTGPRKEKKLNEELQKSGIETYMPLSRELRQWSDRKKWVEEPMFRGYIFVRTVTNDFIKALNHDGAVHFVKFNGRHSVIPEEQIEFIRKIVSNKIRYEVSEEKFEEGDPVEVVQGALKGLKGVWVHKKSKYNVAIHIEQLSRTLTVEIPSAFIKKLPQPDDEEAEAGK